LKAQEKKQNAEQQLCFCSGRKDEASSTAADPVYVVHGHLAGESETSLERPDAIGVRWSPLSSPAASACERRAERQTGGVS